MAKNLYTKNDLKRVQSEEEELSLGRSAFRRDFGRLLHSPACRRLQGKTQLFPGHESDFFRNRLTHSLEVAQIAKGIAQLLNATDQACRGKGNAVDLDLVEFAGLAHDLGHPPFGHNGERALDDCMKEFGGFEGNAQTLRILAKVEKKVYTGSEGGDGCGISAQGVDHRLGLNLTYRSLAAILKYDTVIPVFRGKNDTIFKGYYKSEEPLVAEIKRNVGQPDCGDFKVIECQIMDIADDIAYSTYDLEDAMKGGFSHPLQLLAKMSRSALLDDLVGRVRKKVADVTDREVVEALGLRLGILINKDEGPLEQYTQSKLVAGNARYRSQFTSEMVGAFMRNIKIESNATGNNKFAKLVVERDTLIQIEALKHLNYILMIMSPRLKIVEYRGYEVVQSIFSALTDNGGHHLLPEDVKEMYERLKEKSEQMRVVCDFVAGMTDRYAAEFYGRLKEAGPTIFKPL